MKLGKQLKLVIVAGVILSLSSVAHVAAMIREDGAPVESTNSELQIMTTARNTVAEVKTTLQDRLTQRKAAVETKLTTTQTTRLKTRCKAAQAKLQSVNTRSETAITARLTAFETIQTNLQNLVTKVDGKVDTTDLEASLTTLAEKITSFETTGTTYKQTVADLLEVDCEADPTGFKASLETAKTEQAKVKEEAAAVRTYIKDTIRPQLRAIRSQLAAQSGEAQ